MANVVTLKMQNLANFDGSAVTNHICLPVTSDHLFEATALMRGRFKQVSLQTRFLGGGSSQNR